MRKAVIDLGTNTFHLFIVELEEGLLKTLYKEKIAVKIGKNGISKGLIAKDAMKRAVHTLEVFKTVLNQFHVDDVTGVATSAIRNAANGQELLDKIYDSTQIEIQIIDGDKEAELIFEGVRAADAVGSDTQLVMDIGGGSVEFIIGNESDIYWKQSFEIGAQRLLDKFHKHDPMPPGSVTAMFEWLDEELADLKEAVKTHQPKGLIGCSGTFDTLTEIYFKESKQDRPVHPKVFELPMKAYRDIHRELLTKDKPARLAIPGMVSMRVDMIVVASCLISYVSDLIPTEYITACTYALKEGVLYSIEHKPIAEKQ
ncbi:exopolyphosphatase [Roseivirga sp.]|uniref:Ppx/GppA phosphatase family protein n=1 Tax=Roseivirga sp. TaxID=1964215 RepID=UPI003B529EFF